MWFLVVLLAFSLVAFYFSASTGTRDEVWRFTKELFAFSAEDLKKFANELIQGLDIKGYLVKRVTGEISRYLG